MLDEINTTETALFIFSYPLWLWLAPIYILGLFYILKRAPENIRDISQISDQTSTQIYRHPTANFQQTDDTGDTSKNIKKIFPLRIFISYAVFGSLLLISLAQPIKLGQELPKPQQYRDIVFIVDSSVSMVLRDYIVDDKRTERMTMLKIVLSHFINRLEGSRIGIIVFSEQAYTLAPLTTDYRLLDFQLQRIRPASLTGRSSDISRALIYSLQKYNSGQQETNKPVFVLISDINRPVRDIDPRAIAKVLSQDGYKLHTIAIGSASYSANDKQDSKLVYHPVNIQLMEEIATAGSGEFFWARDTESLDQALNEIKSVEKRKTTQTPEYIKIPFYQWPLLAALIFLSAFMLFPNKKRIA